MDDGGTTGAKAGMLSGYGLQLGYQVLAGFEDLFVRWKRHDSVLYSGAVDR